MLFIRASGPIENLVEVFRELQLFLVNRCHRAEEQQQFVESLMVKFALPDLWMIGLGFLRIQYIFRQRVLPSKDSNLRQVG